MQETVALVGRFVIALIALLLGAMFVRWGVQLYREGVIARAGTLKTIWKDSQFVLTNGAPGTFLSVGGIVIMSIALLTMPGYDGLNRRVSQKTSAAGAVQRYAAFPLPSPGPDTARPPASRPGPVVPAARPPRRTEVSPSPDIPVALSSDTPPPAYPGPALLGANAFLVLLEPRAWTGAGTAGITRPGAVRVVGLAYHPSGIREVLINGVPATLRRESSGATRFMGRLTAAEVEQDVVIVAHPVEGEPVTRIQRPDGTHVLAAPTDSAASPLP